MIFKNGGSIALVSKITQAQKDKIPCFFFFHMILLCFDFYIWGDVSNETRKRTMRGEKDLKAGEMP